MGKLLYLADHRASRTTASVAVPGPDHGSRLWLLDERRIARGEVSTSELRGLAERLVQMYFLRADELGLEVCVTSDLREYDTLLARGAVHRGGTFYLLMDEAFEEVLNMEVVAFHLRHTQEGRFYARLQLAGDLGRQR